MSRVYAPLGLCCSIRPKCARLPDVRRRDAKGAEGGRYRTTWAASDRGGPTRTVLARAGLKTPALRLNLTSPKKVPLQGLLEPARQPSGGDVHGEHFEGEG